MSRSTKLIAIALLLFIVAGTVFAQNTEPKSEVPAYLLTFFLGFGTGHFYAGENGKPFLIGEATGWGCAVVGSGMVLATAGALFSGSAGDAVALMYGGYSVASLGLLIAAGVHLWEIVDIFSAVPRARKAGGVAALGPVFEIENAAFEAGIAPRTDYCIGVSLKF
jgi:hypothetical protein